jgi:hypothetical protein
MLVQIRRGEISEVRLSDAGLSKSQVTELVSALIDSTKVTLGTVPLVHECPISFNTMQWNW